jgi:DHA1 family multidrug resistance protein-like MFS transporter
VLAVLFVVLILGAGRPMTQPILPGFVGELLDGKGSINFTIGLLFVGMSALSAVAALYAGWLNKRFGFNLVVLVMCVGSGLLIALQGACSNVVQLTALTWIVALLEGVLATGTVTLLSSTVSPAVISGVFGVYQSVQAASGQFGPAIGGSLAVGVGFRGVFPVAGTLFFVAGILSFIVLQRTSRTRPAPDLA